MGFIVQSENLQGSERVQGSGRALQRESSGLRESSETLTGESSGFREGSRFRDRIFIERMTSESKFAASIEGSK